MKKKLLAVALVAAMAMGLMACGGGSSSGSSDAAAGRLRKQQLPQLPEKATSALSTARSKLMQL